MKNLLTFIMTFMWLITGCVHFEEHILTTDNTPVSAQTRAGSVAFDTLPDPYDLANMQAVYEDFGVDTTLMPTDLYVRFLPTDSLQWELLEEEYELALFGFPLDLDIPNGVEYVDPTISEGEIPWQYTTVKPDFEFSDDITYEIIRECYIPEDGSTIENNSPATRATRDEVIEVEKIAYERLGYVVEEPLTRSGGGGGYYPKGKVEVWLDSLREWEPVRGVRVKVNSHTKIDLGAYTDEDGNYQTVKKFWKENVRYTLVFHNRDKDFWLWEGLGNRAKYDHGWHHKSGCDIQITGGMAWQCSVVNNAAWDYYEMCNLEGITLPPEDLKIWVQPNNGASSASMIRRLFAVGIVPSITKVSAEQYFLAVLSYGVVQLAMIVEMVADIFGLKPDLTIGTLDGDHIRIYNVVNHELSHASHFSKVGSGYWSGYISHIANSFLRYGEDYTYGYANTSSYAGICQVGEMWGNAMGNIEMSEKYNNARLSDSYNDLFYRRPYRFFGDGGLDSLTTDDWIHPDPIWALITQKVLTKRQVFGCLTEDVDTVDKLEERMLTSYRDKAQLIEMAFDVNNVVKIPDITGPDNPIMDNVVYSIPANFPTGLTFNGWTVSPEKISGVDYQVFGGFNNRELIIKFITIGEYTITANFIVGGLPYTATKAIDLNFSYANQIVTGNITVPHAYGITVNNVTVQSGASLTLQAPSIVITEPFTVEAGATLVLAN